MNDPPEAADDRPGTPRALQEAIGEFLWKVHDYTNDYIRYGDTKAALVIAWSSALISGLFGLKAHHLLAPSRLTRSPDVLPTIAGVIAAIAFAALGLAAVLGMFVVFPRLWKVKGKGFIFWENVLEYGSGATLLDALYENSALNLHLAERLVVIAKLAHRKYRYLRLAVACGLIGGIFGAIAAVMLS